MISFIEVILMLEIRIVIAKIVLCFLVNLTRGISLAYLSRSTGNASLRASSSDKSSSDTVGYEAMT